MEAKRVSAEMIFTLRCRGRGFLSALGPLLFAFHVTFLAAALLDFVMLLSHTCLLSCFTLRCCSVSLPRREYEESSAAVQYHFGTFRFRPDRLPEQPGQD